MASGMSELIVAAFNDAHTAYLVCGALARLHDEIPLKEHSVVVVRRLDSAEVAIREAVDLSSEAQLSEAFWKTLMGLVFLPSGTDKVRDVPEKLAAIGIDDAFIAGVSRKVRPNTLAVALIAGEAAGDRVIGILQGFRGQITRTRLTGNDRKQLMDVLAGE
jgi:uncharacterized membrane protein